MHRYRIVAQISLVLSILNLVLAAPVAVQRIREAHGTETVVAEDVASPLPSPDAMVSQDSQLSSSDAMESPHLSPDVIASPHLSPDVMASLHSSPDTMESPQEPPSPSGSTSSGYSYDLPSSEDPGPSDPLARYAWLMDRPARLNLNPPELLHGSAFPRPPSPELPEIQLPESLHGSASLHPSSPGSSGIEYPEWVYELAPEMPPSSPLPESLHGSASPHPSSSGLSEMQLPEWVEELAPEEMPQEEMPQEEVQQFPQPMESDRATTETATYSPSDGFTSSRHTSSLSSIDSYPWSDEWLPTPYLSVAGESLSSYYSSALDGSSPTHVLTSMPSHHSMSEALVPPQHPTSDGPPLSATPPDIVKFFNEKTIKKIKVVAGLAIVGGAIAGIVGAHIKHHKHRDGQDT